VVYHEKSVKLKHEEINNFFIADGFGWISQLAELGNQSDRRTANGN